MQQTTYRNAVRARALLALLAVLCCLPAAPGRAQEQPDWWHRSWPYRTLVKAPGRQAADTIYARAWVHLPLGADPQGRDIVVVAPDGKPVPFGIVHSTDDNRHLLAWTAVDRNGTYAVYFGNAQPPAVRHSLPDAGLVLSTMPIPTGLDSAKWPAVEAAVEKAEGLYGADFVPSVFGGYNPFGPQENYISVYRGKFNVPRQGRYRLAVLSEHSAYVVVDGKPVVNVTGWQNINALRHGQVNKPVDLSAGLHDILFVAFSYSRPMRSGLAWSGPGEKNFQLVPEAAFPHLRPMEAVETQRLGSTVQADFEARPQAYCEAGGARMVAVRFISRTGTAGDALVNAYRWTFGDGTTSGDAQPEHTFLAPGLYEVRLDVSTTSRRNDSITKLVRVASIWDDLDFQQPKLDAFWEATQRYDPNALETPALLGAWRFWRAIEKKEKANRALTALGRRAGRLEPADRYEVAMALGDYYHGAGFDLGEAEKWLKVALEATAENQPTERWQARFALCDHYYYYEKDPAKGRLEYEKLRIDYPQIDPSLRRLALIRVGDTYRTQARADEAMKRYAEAEKDPNYLPDKPRAVVEGAVMLEVKSYMARGEGEEALKRLEELLWYYPTLRLDGKTTLMRCEAALLMGDWQEAKKHADAYIDFATDRNYLPSVHVAAGEACTELGLRDEAVKHYRTVVDKFKEAPEVQAAADALIRLGE